MSIRQGNKVIAGHINYHPDLFDHKWADHLLNDVSWLRADTFSWQSGAVYQAAYQHLENDIDGKTLQSETVGGTTIQFYLADDGHKICPSSEESNVTAIYNATGVAWYYIIDTVNTRFKLPRSKHNKYAASLNVFGNGNPLVMTDGTDTLYLMRNYMGVNEYRNTVQITTNSLAIGESKSISQAHIQKGIGVSTDSSKSGMQVVQTQDTDQYKYLYFYVGNFTQTALENTAGLNASLFNNKVDLDGSNATFAHIVEKQDPTAGNNYTWYRKYSDGWVEQGGYKQGSSSTYVTVTLPVVMANTNYYVGGHPLEGANNSAASLVAKPLNTRTTTTVQFISCFQGTFWNGYFVWQVSGMAA